MNKTFVVSLIVTALIAIGAYFVPKTIVNPVTTVTSVSNPDSYVPYFGINGVRTFYTNKALNTATTTPCAIKSPSATSTLVSSILTIRVATSTATVWTLATSTNGFATTTSAGSYSLASGAQGSFAYASSGNTNVLIAPDSYVVWGVQGTVISGSTKLLGSCQAVFQTI